jgi:hypothetical protein
MSDWMSLTSRSSTEPLEVANVAARDVHLITFDTGMAFRARPTTLKVHRLDDDLRRAKPAVSGRASRDKSN